MKRFILLTLLAVGCNHSLSETTDWEPEKPGRVKIASGGWAEPESQMYFNKHVLDKRGRRVIIASGWVEMGPVWPSPKMIDEIRQADQLILPFGSGQVWYDLSDEEWELIQNRRLEREEVRQIRDDE